ncbi:MAG: hypothetical protein QXL61_07130 [Archaeoglobaceae archaeon]
MIMKAKTFFEDYEYYRPFARAIRNHFALKDVKIPNEFVLDATILHYKRWSSIVFNPKARSPWKRVLQSYYDSDEYKVLNEKVSGDPLLAKYATICFLNRFVEALQDYRSEKITPENMNTDLPLTQKDGEVLKAIASELKREAKRIMEDIEGIEGLRSIVMRGGTGFSNEGVPVLNLDDPEEVRRAISSRILVSFVKIAKSYMELAKGGDSSRVPTLHGGIPVGVKTMTRFAEIAKALPQEMIDEDIFTMKTATRTLRVTENYGSLKDTVVYIDKSGSMYESFGTEERVPKISFACASAIALAKKLRSSGAKMTLKFFDVDVYEEVNDYARIIQELLRVRAEGGTRINKVLEDAGKYANRKVIIVTDGIDSVDEELCKKLKKRCDVRVVFINTTNETMGKHFECFKIKKPEPIILKV